MQSIIIGSLCFAAAAFAAASLAVQFPLIIRNDDNVPIFSMGPNACLRGPMKFTNDRGLTVFTLEKDADYPAGCSSK